MKKNKYSGGNFDDFLEEEGILEEVTASVKEKIASGMYMFNVEIDLKHQHDPDDLSKWVWYEDSYYQHCGKVTCEKYGNVATIYRSTWSYTPGYIGDVYIYIDAGLIGTGTSLTDIEEIELKRVLADILEPEGYTLTLLYDPLVPC